MNQSDCDYWRGRWTAGQTRWDIGACHEGLALLCERAADAYPIRPHHPTIIRVYAPGSGRAHDSAALVSRSVPLSKSFEHASFQCVATDFAPEAIEEAMKLYGTLATQGLTLRIEDARGDVPPPDVAAYDWIFDRAMLCALRPELRPAYLNACKRRLKPRGLFLSIPFTKIAVTDDHPAGAGPPFEITLDSLKSLMGHFGFDHVHSEPLQTSRPGTVITEESISIFRLSP